MATVSSGTSSCTVTLSSAASVTATYAASVALIQDTRTISIPNPGVYPTKGVTQTDPVTNFKVTRVADKSELTGDYGGYKSGLSTIVYSRYTPVNTTGEYVLVHGDNSTSALPNAAMPPTFSSPDDVIRSSSTGMLGFSSPGGTGARLRSASNTTVWARTAIRSMRRTPLTF